MPLYEYTCGDCGKTFEFLARNSEQTPDKCPSCEGTTLKKQFSAFAISTGSSSSPAAKCESCPNQGGCPYMGGE